MLGVVVGCQKIVFKYASPFFKDLVWLIDCVATDSSDVSKLCTCSIASHLLQLEIEMEGDACRRSTQGQVTWTKMDVISILRTFKQCTLDNDLPVGYQRLNLVVPTADACSQNYDNFKLRPIYIHHFMASSAICHINRSIAYPICSLDPRVKSAYFCSKRLFLLATLSSLSLGCAEVFVSIFLKLTADLKRYPCAQHTYTVILSVTHDLSYLRGVKGTRTQFNVQKETRTLSLLAQIIGQSPPQDCEVSILLVSNLRSWSRIIHNQDSIQMRSLRDAIELSGIWLARRWEGTRLMCQ